MQRERLAWAAGLFEGEGCITRVRQGHKPVLFLSMTDEDVVRSFHGAVGVGSVRSYLPRSERHKPTYRWQATSFEAAQAVIAMLWPWLGQRRRARATEVLLDRRAAIAEREAPHGTNARYTSRKWRCRCEACREAHAMAARRYKAM